MKKALKNKDLTKQEKYDVARGVAKTIKEKARESELIAYPVIKALALPTIRG